MSKPEQFRVIKIEIPLVASTQVYQLKDAPELLQKGRVVAIGHRLPNAAAYCEKNQKPLVSSGIFHATHIGLRTLSGKEVLKVALSVIGLRDCDQPFFLFPEGVEIDWKYQESRLYLANSAVLAAAVVANETYELTIVFEENC